jgi:hypothetical protein
MSTCPWKSSVGLVMVSLVTTMAIVGTPGGADAASARGSTPSIVTVARKGVSVTVPGAPSQYFFVGSTSDSATMSDSSFGEIGKRAGTCPNPAGTWKTAGPVGSSSMATGSFSSTGAVSAIAGVGISGYSWKPVPSFGATCQGGVLASPEVMGSAQLLPTKDEPQTLLLLLGTIGVDGPITASVGQGLRVGCNTPVSIKRLTTSTFGRTAATYASVGVFLVSVPPGTTECDIIASGTIEPSGTYGFYGGFSKMYQLKVVTGPSSRS